MPVRRSFHASWIIPVCALLLLLPSSSTARASTNPRVLAFYYAWYDQKTWTPSLVSDLPAQTYNSSDPAAIARQIQQAQGAGIDAFVVSWIGTNNPTDWNFKTMLGLAQSANFQATIDLEVEHFASTSQVVSALNYVRDNLMNHPAFLREGGRPILFFWREQNFSVRDWANIRAQADPDHQQVWIAEGTDISYQQVFDGHHLYSIAWSPNVSATLGDWGGRVRGAGANKFWVATVMPGYDDTRTSRPDRFARARGRGDFYRATWQAAIGSNPDWVIINSFNEWVEGTMIEPSASYGNLYLDLTRQFAAQFKAGERAPVPIAVAATVTPPAPPALQADQRLTTDILRVRAGPGTDYTVLGRLGTNRVVRILGRTQDSLWLQIAYPDPDHMAWVSAEYVAPLEGIAAFPVAKTLPLPVYFSGDARARDETPPLPARDERDDGPLYMFSP